MRWLNYHHLLYFWTVAREGSIAKACGVLHLTQPTVSAQLKALEKSVKTPLFERQGRSLALTDAGKMVYRYADEIFSLGRELEDVVRGRPAGGAMRLVVGVADTLPKLVVHRLLRPAFHIGDEVRVSCVDGPPDRLLTQLALHEVDIVLSDSPTNPQIGLRAFNHLLGESGITFFGTADLVKQYRRGFPESLVNAPFLMPMGNSVLGRSLEQWFDDQGIRPHVRGEFADSALLKVFGSEGEGMFAAPTVVEEDVERAYRVGIVGRTDAIRERFYAITVQKRLQHPAVVAISKSAKKTLAAP
jgi:LysR family transcriptional activator of nhaA